MPSLSAVACAEGRTGDAFGSVGAASAGLGVSPSALGGSPPFNAPLSSAIKSPHGNRDTRLIAAPAVAPATLPAIAPAARLASWFSSGSSLKIPYRSPKLAPLPAALHSFSQFLISGPGRLMIPLAKPINPVGSVVMLPNMSWASSRPGLLQLFEGRRFE